MQIIEKAREFQKNIYFWTYQTKIFRAANIKVLQGTFVTTCKIHGEKIENLNDMGSLGRKENP